MLGRGGTRCQVRYAGRRTRRYRWRRDEAVYATGWPGWAQLSESVDHEAWSLKGSAGWRWQNFVQRHARSAEERRRQRDYSMITRIAMRSDVHAFMWRRNHKPLRVYVMHVYMSNRSFNPPGRRQFATVIYTKIPLWSDKYILIRCNHGYSAKIHAPSKLLIHMCAFVCAHDGHVVPFRNCPRCLTNIQYFSLRVMTFTLHWKEKKKGKKVELYMCVLDDMNVMNE